MPTPPKASGGGSTAAATSTSASTGTQTALEFASQLETYVGNLKRELRGYGDANTVGRDAQALRSFFDQIWQCEVQIAHAMGIDWTPST